MQSTPVRKGALHQIERIMNGNKYLKETFHVKSFFASSSPIIS